MNEDFLEPQEEENPIWETHDFVIEKLTENEAEYNFALSILPSFVLLFEKGGITKKELFAEIDKCLKTCKSLQSLYNKHLLSIKEIRDLVNKGDVPPEREIVSECIDELELTTKELKLTIDASERMLLFVKKEHDL